MKGDEQKIVVDKDVEDVVVKIDVAAIEKKEVNVKFNLFVKVEVEDAVVELCVDVVCFCVKMVEDVVGGFWWRWIVGGGLDPMKKERRVEVIWKGSTVCGGHKSMRRGRRKKMQCCWR